MVRDRRILCDLSITMNMLLRQFAVLIIYTQPTLQVGTIFFVLILTRHDLLGYIQGAKRT